MSRIDGGGHDSQTQRTLVTRMGAKEDKRAEEALCISSVIKRDMDGSTVHRRKVKNVSDMVLKVTSSPNALRNGTPVITQVDRILLMIMTENQYLLSS